MKTASLSYYVPQANPQHNKDGRTGEGRTAVETHKAGRVVQVVEGLHHLSLQNLKRKTETPTHKTKRISCGQPQLRQVPTSRTHRRNAKAAQNHLRAPAAALAKLGLVAILVVRLRVERGQESKTTVTVLRSQYPKRTGQEARLLSQESATYLVVLFRVPIIFRNDFATVAALEALLATNPIINTREARD